MFAETPLQILSEADVDFFRMGLGFEDVNVVHWFFMVRITC